MNILFRVDASAHIGMGHLRRTLALATEFKKQGCNPFFLIDSRGERLTVRVPFPRIPKIGKKHWDLVIVDSYRISGAEYKKIRHATGRIALITDMKIPNLPCDALINHNLFAKDAMYSERRRAGTKLLLGPRYAMIREEIAHARKTGFRVRNRIQKVLLTLGGGPQPANAVRLLNCIASVARNVEVLLVSPSQTFPPLPKHLPGGNTCRLIRNPKHMGNIMRQADIAVSAAGVTSLELACLGVPAMVVVLADNQKDSASAAETEGIGLNLGPPGKWTAERFHLIYHRLERPILRRSMSRKASMLVDGHGAGRLAAELTRLVDDFAHVRRFLKVDT